MKGKSKYIFISLILFLITLSLFYKFYELKHVAFDGDGIGVYYFPFVHNERVPNEEVASYANGFLTASIIFLIATMSSLVPFLKRKSA